MRWARDEDGYQECCKCDPAPASCGLPHPHSVHHQDSRETEQVVLSPGCRLSMKRILQCTLFFGPTAVITASGSHIPDPGWRRPERRLYNAVRVQQTNRVGSIVLIILSLTHFSTVGRGAGADDLSCS
jgi:hypothetical protein